MSNRTNSYPLILNKVASPQYATATLRRARLIDWLNAAAGCRAIVIAADAGYGKTTLLWQWEREASFPCYWYKLDRNDRDWTFHVSYLIEAIAQRHPGFGTRTQSALRQLGGPGTSRPGVTAYLLAEMHERLREPCTFILDDWHYVNAVTEVRGLWNQVLRDAPPTCRFVFASRGKPQLQFARFKTHGGYAELRTDSLRFTLQETRELFADVYSDPLEAADLAALDRQTEGWAASLQLIEVSLKERGREDSRRSFLQSLSTRPSTDLFEYLAEEVLDQQAQETRHLLLQTSILQQITPELAERLAGVADGHDALTSLAKRGLFTTQLDEKRFRYHNLFRDFLLRQLSVTASAAEVAGLHIHAASYFETTHQWPEAIHHYLAAGLQRQAARLIARYGEALTDDGRLELIDSWLETFAPGAIQQNARLSLLWGEIAGMRGDWADALAALDRARAFFQRRGDSRLEALACLKLSSVLGNYGDVEASAKRAMEALDIAPDDAQDLRLRLQGNLAVTQTWIAEGLEAVAASCRRIADQAESLGLEHYAAIARHNLGYVELELGRVDEAIEHLHAASEFWERLPPNPFADNSDVVRALVATGEHGRAHDLADSAVDRTRPWARPHAEALFGKAYVLFSQGLIDQAEQLLARALERASALGGAKIAMASLMIDCWYLRGRRFAAGSKLPAIIESDASDKRLELIAQTSAALAAHLSQECAGECLKLSRSIAAASAIGMVATPVASRLKLASLSAEHGRRSAVSAIVEALRAALDSGMYAGNRAWCRRLSAHAPALAAASGGPDLLLELLSRDPDGWRAAVAQAVLRMTPARRRPLLDALVRVANRDTIDALRHAAEPDLVQALQSMQIRQAPKLYLQTLGPLLVRRGSRAGAPIGIDKRRLRLLLAYLSARSGQPCQREQIIADLWPEADAQSGVNSLNQSVFQLRRELARQSPESPGIPYVVTTGDGVMLHPDLVHTDLDELRKLSARLPGMDGPKRRQAAADMIALVGGDFLSDLRYEDWVISLQTQVHAEVRSLLAPIAHTDGVFLPHELGVRAASKLLDIDRYDEGSQLAIVEQLAASGKRSAARDLARRFVESIRTELGEEPPATLAAFAVT